MYSYMYHTICSFINRSKMHMYMYYGVDDERHLVIPMHSIVLQYYSRTASAVQPNRPNRPRDIKEREPRSRTATLRNVHRRPFNPSVRSRFPEKGGPQQSRARGKKRYRYAHALLLRHHPLPDHLPGRPSPLSHKLFDSENRPRRVVVHVHIMIL